MILALDIGGSKLVVGSVSDDGRILKKTTAVLTGEMNEKKLLEIIKTTADKLFENDYNSFKSLGATIPALCDSKNGMWLYSPFSGISDFPVAKELSSIFGIPAFIENDVNACATAEYKWGCCKNTENFIWVTVSNGCGGSVVINGKVYAGHNGNAGEIGHIIVEENEPMPSACGCGNMGCLEAHAAGPAIGKRYARLANKTYNGEKSKEIGILARSGDETARQVWEKTGYYLGKAIASAVNMINPAKVILGGGVTMDYELFKEPLINTFNKMCFKSANPDISIELTALGYDAALLGAAALAAEKII